MKLIWFCMTVLFLVGLTSCSKTIKLETIEPETIESETIESETIESETIEPESLSHPFPRLGMWWPNPYEANVKDMARYDLLLDSFDDPYLIARLNEIKELNETQINLKPLGPTERHLYLHNWEEDIDYPNPEVTHLPSDFFLLQTGTYLANDIQETDTKIFVNDMFDKDGQPLFHLDGEVVIGQYETAKIIEILWDEDALLVERGYIRAASPHQKGERIASHIRFWPGTWVMNVTDQCPKLLVYGLDYPVNYIDYYFALITGKTKGIYTDPLENRDRLSQMNLYDGVIIDRFEDKESWLKWVNDENVIYIDLYHDNTYVPTSVFDNAWENGTSQLYHLLHSAYPDIIIIRNNPLTSRGLLFNGQVYETFGWSHPSQEWWEALVIAQDMEEYYSGYAYLEWWKHQDEPLVLFEVYEDEWSPDENGDLAYDNPFLKDDFVPNYQRMRFSLCSALLGNGYYSYEINTNGHGSLGLLWFDEYDNSGEGKGYLGYPLSDARLLPSGGYQREFQNGLVLVNPTDSAINISLDTPYQKIKGKQVPEINSGEVVSEVTINRFDGIILLKTGDRN